MTSSLALSETLQSAYSCSVSNVPDSRGHGVRQPWLTRVLAWPENWVQIGYTEPTDHLMNFRAPAIKVCFYILHKMIAAHAPEHSRLMVLAESLSSENLAEDGINNHFHVCQSHQFLDTSRPLTAYLIITGPDPLRRLGCNLMRLSMRQLGLRMKTPLSRKGRQRRAINSVLYQVSPFINQKTPVAISLMQTDPVSLISHTPRALLLCQIRSGLPWLQQHDQSHVYV
ncbi:hypothetical protein RRG08_035024 [Elysia crispata]|uniref:Uncharacterized protein n=1 Tax=Elysia crispata TaxID=231223 RepID=A0AAE0ZS47_9GAST|nr:hypothetical protein RRG08_035024 [Elysia crispata]